MFEKALWAFEKGVVGSTLGKKNPISSETERLN
jgi:hypothetical protein